MAGIYVHVPFCKVKCHYCDFHFSVQLKNRAALIASICNELVIRQNYIGDEPVRTIYFGGGTPSVIEIELLNEILQTIRLNYTIDPDCEITLECNPDDLEEEKLIALHKFGVNRLSIGIQSFNNNVLEFMNRAHNSTQAINSVIMAKACGFDNITIDLIYGVPGTTMETWKNQLDLMLELGVPHLSAYCLTIEENTVFGNWQKKGKLKPYEDQESLKQFQYLIDFMEKNGYEQYEISNFARPSFISKHNSAYWLGEKYLGVGPSAHSFNGAKRSWNVANNPKYIQLIKKEEAFNEEETLSLKDQFNEYILTRLRTKWGIALADLTEISAEMLADSMPVLMDNIAEGNLVKNGDVYTLTNQGKYIADGISADLFSDVP
ncbi:MAG: radical SAM family heme chaperone HemW [Crocinitomix sp.]|nr:radical SAM family heme chaperone HemW [Crocinitomix sp.]